ncbi:MAG TPA: CvpA family protein [Acidobacteriaceae bacterium]|nr:CvpA family protein [Acidobacteriaceae bacterium]
MVLIDWLIVIVLLVSVLSAAKNGFFLEVFSLAGIIIGFVLASWNYQRLLPWLTHWIHSLPAAGALSFLLIALGVMLLAGILGRVVRWSVHAIGLGWADRFLGSVFGFAKGFVLITIAVLVIAAFFPRATWFQRSRLAPCFLSAAHKVSALAPENLELRIRDGVTNLRKSEPHWLKPAATLVITVSKAGPTRA